MLLSIGLIAKKCEQPLAPTEGIIYEVSSDGTYAEVIAYSGTASKILIADTYNGSPIKNKGVIPVMWDNSF